MSILTTLRHQATPPSPLAGRLATQSLLFALGEGTFMAGSAVFFTQVVGLTAAQVGLGPDHRRDRAFIAAYPMGRIVDRFGAQALLGDQLGRPGRDVRGVAVHRQLRAATSRWPSSWR